MTDPTPESVTVTQAECGDWLVENCGKGLPYENAHDLSTALHGAAYTLRQIEGTTKYQAHIGQSGPAASGIRWLLEYVARNEIARHRLTATPSPESPEVADLTDRFWLIVREPGMVPDRKGPWKHRETAKVLREFMAANPRAFIDVLTIGADGVPDVDHGPQVLQMADGRSMSVGRKHNERVREAEEQALASRPSPIADEGMVERIAAFETAVVRAERFRPRGPRSGMPEFYAQLVEEANKARTKLLAILSPPVEPDAVEIANHAEKWLAHLESAEPLMRATCAANLRRAFQRLAALNESRT